MPAALTDSGPGAVDHSLEDRPAHQLLGQLVRGLLIPIGQHFRISGCAQHQHCANSRSSSRIHASSDSPNAATEACSTLPILRVVTRI